MRVFFGNRKISEAFNHLKISNKINFSLYSSFVILLVLFWGIHGQYSKMETEYKEILDNSNDFLRCNQELVRKLNILFSENIAYSRQHTGKKPVLNSDCGALLFHTQEGDNLSKLLKNNNIMELEKKVKQGVESFLETSKNIHDSRPSDSMNAEEIIALHSALSTIYDNIESIEKETKKVHSAYMDKHEAGAESFKYSALIIIFLSFGVLFYINRKIAISIVENLESLNESVESFFNFIRKKERNIETIQLNSSDEIVAITETINKNIVTVRKIIDDERESKEKLESLTNSLVERVALATLENMKAYKEMENTQREMVLILGAIVEERSDETSKHVVRVAEYSMLLGRLLGLSEKDCYEIKHASPMHDVGKIGIPDSILNKEGLLTECEYVTMKTHSCIGYEILRHSEKSILKAAAVIAHEHHEKYDGTGYPRGIKGEDIHIFARITAVADVFDALLSERRYKNAWLLDDVLEYLQEQKSKQFDPKIVDIFLSNLNLFLNARESIDSKTAA